MSTQKIERYKFEEALEQVLTQTLSDKGLAPIWITGDDGELQDLSLSLEVSIAGARADVSIPVLTGDDGAKYREPIFYDAMAVIRLVVPEQDEFGNQIDWAEQVATVRESIRERHMPAMNALLELHEIIDIMPTGTERTTFENRKAFTFSYSILFQIKQSAFSEE